MGAPVLEDVKGNVGEMGRCVAGGPLYNVAGGDIADFRNNYVVYVLEQLGKIPRILGPEAISGD